jgi:hypothetical protein
MEKFDDSRSQELLAEELTAEEVRELLVRLHTDDLGGSENATVGSVVEATGAELDTVSSLLAEIRKEAYQELFGDRLDDHEHRIIKLESRHAKAPVQVPPIQAPASIHRVRRKTEVPDPPPRVEPEVLDQPPIEIVFPPEQIDGHYLEESVSPLTDDPRFGDDGKPVAITIVIAFIIVPLVFWLLLWFMANL